MSGSSSKSPASKSKSKSKSKSPSSTSKRERIDILVPCHSYLNEPLKYSGPHDPVFLFLYNEKAKRYDKINITDVLPPIDSGEVDEVDGEATLKSLEKDKKIHIKFIDDAVLDKDVNKYQYNKPEQLIGKTFDYIFPIHCTGNSAQNYKSFLKPTGKLLDPVFRVSEDYLNTLKPAAAEKLRMDIIDARKTFVPYEKGQDRIEFHKYRESKEPYIYKEDIVGGYGWYNVYYAPSDKSSPDNPYGLPGGSSTRQRSTRQRSTRQRSTRKRSTRQRSTRQRSTRQRSTRQRSTKKSKKSIRHKIRR